MKTQTFYRHLSSKPPQSLYKRKLLKSQAVSTGWTGHLCLFAVIQLQGFQVIGGASSCFLLWRGFSSASKASLFTLICSEPDVSMWLTTVRKNNKATSAGNRKKKNPNMSLQRKLSSTNKTLNKVKSWIWGQAAGEYALLLPSAWTSVKTHRFVALPPSWVPLAKQPGCMESQVVALAF